MILHRGWHGLHQAPKNAVWAIGNCDGFHRGHQALLELARKTAQKHGTFAGLITFEPLPQMYFGAPDPTRIHSRSVKLCAFKQIGMDYILVIPFKKKLAELSATSFIQKILIESLSAAAVVVGDDFHFGKKRLGNIKTLQAETSFETKVLQAIDEDGERISSSRIRQLLMQGNVSAAAKLLGKQFQVIGRVKQGRQLARSLGAPTANIRLKQRLTLAFGVYLVNICLEESPGKVAQYWGVANYGTRPTVDGLQTELEVHLLDFNRSIYGEKLCVDFIEYLRPEQKFSGIDALAKQVKKDIQDAKVRIEHYETNKRNY